MKYYNKDFEMPEVGKLIIKPARFNYTESDKIISYLSIGFDYKSGNRKAFHELQAFTAKYLESEIKSTEWGYLPKFYSPKDKKMPIGETILVKYNDEINISTKRFKIELNEFCEDYIEIEGILGWLPLSELEKD